MNPNAQQALEDEELGIDEEGEDVDYDMIYGGLDIESSPMEKQKAPVKKPAPKQPTPEAEESNAQLAKRGAIDSAKQFTKEAAIALGGAGGDIGEAVGALLPESPITAGRRKLKENLISKAEKENRDLTEGEAYLADQADNAITSLPTSKDFRKANKALGGPGKAETTAGKYFGRAGKLVGATAPFGANPRNLLSAGAAGVAGQGVEELGFGPLWQAAAEISVMLKTGPKSTSAPLSSRNKVVQQEIENLKSLGYTEEEITLAINRASGGEINSIRGSKGEKTQAAFKNFTEHSDELAGEILSSGIPGYEKGPAYVHQLASDAYGYVVDKARAFKINKVEPFFDSVDYAIKEVRRNLGTGKDAQEFIERLTKAGLDAVEKPNADSFISFYKELNSMGNWMTRNQKDRIIKTVKESIKDTFKAEGKEGAILAEEFERVNEGVQRAYKAEEIHRLLQKAETQNGMDYKKFNKVFDSPENVELFSEVLGKQQTENLTRISKLGKEVGDFDKAWKATTKGLAADLVDKASWKYFLYNMDWQGLAINLTGKVGDVAVRSLIEKSLTDPKFQNLLSHGLHAIKNKAPRLLISANQGIENYLEEQGIDINP
jgi:hypothetical protein